eukprot:TRINITY_DN12136_c0_g4_i1.p1 TRINITY_DN12136_c0_g4~~TRINITY_DN12136_c0_g4_i1.p1  ORF type:complete len:127 (+),score=9.39 TRINITY_DN12136_c0_g4_i1:120-500(+)
MDTTSDLHKESPRLAPDPLICSINTDQKTGKVMYKLHRMIKKRNLPIKCCQFCGLERPCDTMQCSHARVELATWPCDRSSEDTSFMCLGCGEVGLGLAVQQQCGNGLASTGLISAMMVQDGWPATF